MITINSNISAKQAQNSLNTNQSNLQDNMLQLTTGLRINSAADDAAGMQIANRMETQMGGMAVAQRNASDAISLAQTAEGAMQESTNVMNRVRDLALQSYNDTNTDDDRDAIQKEVEQLKAEVNRIATTTNFAGIDLLDGSSSDMTFQIGAGANETISFGIDSMMGKDLGAEIQDGQTGATITDGVIANDPFELIIKSDEEGGENQTIEVAKGTSVDDAVDQINSELSDLGFDAQAIYDDSGSAPVIDIVAHKDEVALIDPLDPIKNLSVDQIDVSTQAGAQKALVVLDEALMEVDDQRSELGAVQNRLESTINNLTSMEENLGVAQSGIMDADFAEQTVEMTSNQMLMQAGTSVLAQAKTMPQYASMLLQ